MSDRKTKLDTQPEASLLAACKRALPLIERLMEGTDNDRRINLLILGRPLCDELRRAITKAEQQ
jgi:hypothetical protein